MDLTKVLAQLRLELDHIDAAIVSLERLQTAGVKRGRPPRTLADLGKLKTTGPSAAPQRRRAGRGRPGTV
jgi:hypothetical protein